MTIERVVVWFSAGVTSAIAAKLTIEKYQDRYPVVLVNTDTGSEHPDNFRFMSDCENWLDFPVTILKSPNYKDTFDVYHKDGWLVGPYGARCSLVLKKRVRQGFEQLRSDLQIFGYDANERKRADKFIKNNPLVNIEFPLIDANITKNDARCLLLQSGIQEPLTYSLGFPNANCLKRGCVKGCMGYWNHYRRIFYDNFWDMAQLERELDVAICKTYKRGKRIRMFLDELPANAGRYKIEPIQCGLFCGDETK